MLNIGFTYDEFSEFTLSFKNAHTKNNETVATYTYVVKVGNIQNIFEKKIHNFKIELLTNVWKSSSQIFEQKFNFLRLIFHGESEYAL